MFEDDEELGIDRSQIEPIRFVSAVNCKPVNPPYLKLANLDSFIKLEGLQQSGQGDRKLDHGLGDSTAAETGIDDLSSTMVSRKSKNQDVTQSYKAEMRQFRNEMEDQYYNLALKLMEDFEHRKRQKERDLIKQQMSGDFKKSVTKRGQQNDANKASSDNQNPKEKAAPPQNT